MKQVDSVLECQHGDMLKAVCSAMNQVKVEAQVPDLCGAECGERSMDPANRRYSTRPHVLETRLGSV